MTKEQLWKEIDSLKRVVAREQKSLTEKQKKLSKMELKYQEDDTVTISDHAVLRYLERVCGINVEQMRDSMLSPELIDAVKVGATSYMTKDVVFKIKNKTIVTIM